MGYRCNDTEMKAGAYDNRVIQITISDKDSSAKDDVPVALTLANDWETLRFTKENMDAVVANLVRVKQMDAHNRRQVEESAELFEKNLEPLFALISATAQEHVMDKLSVSLKKALLLMAMDRYNCDSDRICRALGMTKGKLEKELQRCGLSQQTRKAA
jgi:DNA-binding protein Fis